MYNFVKQKLYNTKFFIAQIPDILHKMFLTEYAVQGGGGCAKMLRQR